MFRIKIASWRQLLTSRWLAAVILICGLQLTFFLWLNAREHAEAVQAVKFRQAMLSATEAIGHRMEAYRQVLTGVEHLYLSSQFVSSQEFRQYVDDYTQSAQFGSLNAIGFIKYIHLNYPETFKDLEMPVKSLLAKLEFVQGDDELAPVLYIEPRNDQNQETLLKNTFLDARLRSDLLQASETQDVVMSGQSSVSQPMGQQYFLHAPVYHGRPDEVAATERRRMLNGWVFLRFDIHAFLAEALQGVEQRQVHFDVFDLNGKEGQTPLYHSPSPDDAHPHERAARFSAAQTLNMHGHLWSMRARTTPAFEAMRDMDEANEVAVMGVCTSLLLAGLAYLSMVLSRERLTVEKYSQALTSSEQRWKFAMESTGDGVWDWSVLESRVVFSDHWKKMLGFAPHELEHKPTTWMQRIHPEDIESVQALQKQVLDGEREQYAIEYRMLCKDGSWKWVFDRGMVLMRDEAGKPMRILGTLADISKIKHSEEVVWQFANVDTLTGLPNRRMFFERLEQAVSAIRSNSQKLAIIFLDLDRFKEVNDSQGHDQGDKLLMQAARRLTACVANKDLVSRLGGDEFVLMLGDATAGYVESLAQRVLQTLSQPFQLEDALAYVTASLGIAIFPDDASNKEDLMKRVDQAMYASKQKGGNCFTYFTPRMQQHAENRMRLSQDLRQAIVNQEFFLEYQPVVNLQTNQVIKAEALLRWQHPVKGLIPPMEFIGIAEDNLLITPIGEWVFKTAIAQCKAWRKALDPQFQMAINKSPVQFAPDHRKQEDWLMEMGQAPEQRGMVVVEITERLLLDASAHVSERLAQYRQAGVQVALDDFGTGYSALSYLKKFSIDYVKIDRSFVRELGVSSEDGALCQAIIVMAHSLGMQVIAEGIENLRQLRILQEMGCDYGQGYYFSPPLRSGDFLTWYQTWQQSAMLPRSL